MIKLITLLKETILNEYGNKGPSKPEVYFIKGKKFFPYELSKLSSISNLTYDVGGGETHYFEDEPNVVIIDNIGVNYLTNEETFGGKIGFKNKIYIDFNLENYFAFPKANLIIVSQITFHMNNVENLAKTVIHSLKPNGKIKFFSSEMSKECKSFIKILLDNSFFLPEGIDFLKLNKFKNKTIVLKNN